MTKIGRWMHAERDPDPLYFIDLRYDPKSKG